MKKVRFMDTSFRDGFQSVYGARVTTKDFLPAVEASRKAGISHMEAGGGARFQSLFFYCNESAFDMMDSVREAAGPDANLQTLARGINVVALSQCPRDIIDLHAKMFKKHGITTIRNFDALNDVRNLRRALEAVQRTGKHAQGCLSYTVSPVHTEAKYAELAKQLQDEGLNAQPIESLEAGVETADVISCATMSTEPLIHGHWLKPGQHVDLMGAFKPSMRETDDKAVQVADVFCDTFAGALKEGGDLVQPIESGALTREAVLADLFDLAQGKHPGRAADDQITLFKSTGAALEDLAAAVLAYERSGD